MTTTNKNFKVRHGLTVAAEGITFSDGSTQTTAASGGGGGVTVDNTFPATPSDGDLFFYTNNSRLHVYNSGTWYVLANFEDLTNVTEHNHYTGVGESGLLKDVYSYNGNGVVLPSILESWSPIDGGSPSDTYVLSIDGGGV